MTKKHLPILLLLLLLFYRIIIFTNATPELFPQEALLGYRASQLIQRQTDELHRHLPLIFSSVHGYGNPFPTYLVTGSIFLFGINSWSIRLPFALISLLGLAALWFMIRKLLPQHPSTAWWSAIILVLSPIHTALSMTPSEWFLYFNLVLIITAIFLYLKKSFNKICASRTIAAANLTWFEEFQTLKFLYGNIFTFTILISLIIVIYNLNLDKAQLTRIFSDQFNSLSDISITNSINQMRGEGSYFQPSAFWSRLFYNKTFILQKLFENAFNHLKPQFYFAQAGHSSDYAATNFGTLVTVLIIPFFIGFKTLIQLNRRTRIILATIFIIGITPSVWSLPSPHLEKMLLAAIPITIITALGLQHLNSKWKSIILLLAILHYSMFAYDHLIKQPARAHISRCSGIQQLTDYLISNIHNYPLIYVSDAYCPQAGIQIAYYLEQNGLETQIPDLPLDPQYKITISQLNNLHITNQNNWKLNFKQPMLLITDINTPSAIFNRYQISPQSTGPQPSCFKEIHHTSNIYGKKIYQIYQTTNPSCIPKISHEAI